ncbi:hypothetical protein C8046_11540 [Serinibacter arcticus]|uniref:Uncharacterized protein n=1 Tax=Serinibacter arcticus TaxID=1655435 RepID=A0A2U1ZW31_9MICO|nr:hypothetical protein [Serinibacter arcticus]PWD51188.1 hypothetical protein C8046_11540 [Serinibacter arcticus]
MIWTIITRIRDAVRDVERMLGLFQARLDWAAARAAQAGQGPVVAPVLAAMAELVRHWQAAADWIADALDGLGDPEALETASDSWVTIGPVLRDIEDRVRDLYSSVGANWEGSAADAYAQRIPLQKDAIEEARTASTGMSGPLLDMKAAILAMAGAVLLAILTLVGALMAAWAGLVAGTIEIAVGSSTLIAGAIVSATGVGAPVGVPAMILAGLGVAAGVATVLGALGAAAIGVTIAVVTLDTAASTFASDADGAESTLARVESTVGTWPWLAAQ